MIKETAMHKIIVAHGTKSWIVQCEDQGGRLVVKFPVSDLPFSLLSAIEKRGWDKTIGHHKGWLWRIMD